MNQQLSADNFLTVMPLKSRSWRSIARTGAIPGHAAHSGQRAPHRGSVDAPLRGLCTPALATARGSKRADECAHATSSMRMIKVTGGITLGTFSLLSQLASDHHH